MRHLLTLFLATAALSPLPALAADVDTDWHFAGSNHAVHAAGTVPLSRFFAVGATGWFPVIGAGSTSPYLVDGKAFFTIPMSGYTGPSLTIAPWAGYRGAFTGSTISHGPGFGLLLDMANRDFPIGFDLQAGTYPFMQGAGATTWFEFGGTVRYTIVDWMRIMGGFRGYMPNGQSAIMGPFAGVTFGER
jgi:hypothetical protein